MLVLLDQAADRRGGRLAESVPSGLGRAGPELAARWVLIVNLPTGRPDKSVPPRPRT
jgi:hypothetical protein